MPLLSYGTRGVPTTLAGCRAMTTGITSWLRTKDRPPHLYALLGRPLLDPDRVALLATLRAANRELLDYQSHPDRAVAARAIELLTELGRARGVLDDPARLAAYDAELVESLRREGASAGVLGPGGVEAAVVAWLGRFHGLDASAAARVARLLAPPAPRTRVFSTGQNPPTPLQVEPPSKPPAPRAAAVAVDLVAAPPLSPPPAPAPVTDERPLLDFGHRDMLMLNTGGVLIVAGVAVGYALVRLTRALGVGEG